MGGWQVSILTEHEISPQMLTSIVEQKGLFFKNETKPSKQNDNNKKNQTQKTKTPFKCG